MVCTTVRLGGTASDIEVFGLAHGLMRMTWVPNPPPDEQSFKAIKDGIDAAGGAKVYLNSGDFYGVTSPTANLELLARFFDKHPEYADRTIIAVKGAVNEKYEALNSEENIRRSVLRITKFLRGTHRLDVFEPARIDTTRSIEDTVRIMRTLIREGWFDHYALSEVGAETLRKGNAVHPVAHVEIEVSPFAYEEETREVIAAAAELQIPVLAYSPQAAGFLTGKFRSHADINPNDFRSQFDRLQPENFDHNIKLVDGITAIAKKRGVTPGQLSIALVKSLGPHIIPLAGSSDSSRTLENIASLKIELTEREKVQIAALMKQVPVKGVRYAKGAPVWG